MKILILANDDSGLYKFRKELLEKFLINHKVYIALPNGEYIKDMCQMGVYFQAVDINRRGKNIFQEAKLFHEYFKIIRKIKPDVVLTYTVKPNIYGGIICRLYHKPYIANITGLGTAIEEKSVLSKILIIFYKQVLKKAECIFFQNHSNRRFFLKRGLKHPNVKCLPGSGVNLTEHCYEEYPVIEGKIIFLFIGRIMRDKGVIELVEASKQLKSQYNNVEIQLMGACEADFEEEFRSMNVQECVNLLGVQKDVHSFIKKCHAVVLPSYHEGMSNVLLEAAACGRPVLTTNVPGCKETFEEGVSGFGFAAKNVKELKEAMERFIQLDYEKKVQMGKAGRERMEKKFNRDIVVKMYEKELGRIAH
ncbi:MAG: glycosyltransferase family 4 protein [Lachnospiraceae bacterium]|nr:glycosyltransferase family 4 protein [Lachnospiraceae bacterium]